MNLNSDGLFIGNCHGVFGTIVHNMDGRDLSIAKPMTPKDPFHPPTVIGSMTRYNDYFHFIDPCNRGGANSNLEGLSENFTRC